MQSAGLRGAEAQEVLAQSSKLAVVGLGETKDIALATGAAMTAYGSDLLSAADAGDIMLATVKEGNLEASELAGSLGKVLPVSAALGVSFAEVGAGTAVYTRLGLSASEAINGQRAAMNALLAPTETAKKTLAGLGLTTEDLREMVGERGLGGTLDHLRSQMSADEYAKFLGSTEALGFALTITGDNAAEYQRTLDSVTDSTGATTEAFDIASETTEAKLNVAMANLQVVGMDIATVVLPAIVWAAEAVVTVLDFLTEGWNELTDSWATSEEQLQDVTKELGLNEEQIKGLVKIYGSKAENSSFLGKLGSYLTTGKDWAEVQKDANEAAMDATTAILEQMAAFDEAEPAFRDKRNATVEYTGQQREQRIAAEEAAEAEEELAERTRENILVTDDATTAFKDLDRSLGFVDSTALHTENSLNDLREEYEQAVKDDPYVLLHQSLGLLSLGAAEAQIRLQAMGAAVEIAKVQADIASGALDRDLGRSIISGIETAFQRNVNFLNNKASGSVGSIARGLLNRFGGSDIPVWLQSAIDGGDGKTSKDKQTNKEKEEDIDVEEDMYTLARTRAEATINGLEYKGYRPDPESKRTLLAEWDRGHQMGSGTLAEAEFMKLHKDRTPYQKAVDDWKSYIDMLVVQDESKDTEDQKKAREFKISASSGGETTEEEIDDSAAEEATAYRIARKAVEAQLASLTYKGHSPDETFKTAIIAGWEHLRRLQEADDTGEALLDYKIAAEGGLDPYAAALANWRAYVDALVSYEASMEKSAAAEQNVTDTLARVEQEKVEAAELARTAHELSRTNAEIRVAGLKYKNHRPSEEWKMTMMFEWDQTKLLEYSPDENALSDYQLANFGLTPFGVAIAAWRAEVDATVEAEKNEKRDRSAAIADSQDAFAAQTDLARQIARDRDRAGTGTSAAAGMGLQHQSSSTLTEFGRRRRNVGEDAFRAGVDAILASNPNLSWNEAAGMVVGAGPGGQATRTTRLYLDGKEIAATSEQSDA